MTDKKAGDLSGGNQKKLQIALSVLGDPQILFLDEPTTNLDPLVWFRVRNLVNKLKGQNKIVVFVTHIMEDVEQLADEVIFMQQGKIIIQGSIQ